MFNAVEDNTTKMKKVTLSLKEKVTQKILDEALNKISSLTGLSHTESLALTNQLLSEKVDNSSDKTGLSELSSKTPEAILEQNEVKFISNLFH